MKIKLFTHTDLDGYSCRIIAELAAGKENVDTVHCGYSDINECVLKFINSNKHINYDYVFITDISVSEEIAEAIDESSLLRYKTNLVDHHATAMYLNKYNWCKVLVDDGTEKVCGTSMFYDLLLSRQIIDANKSIEHFVEKVKRYDTWLWREKYDDLNALMLNDLFKIYGPRRFLDIYRGRLLSESFELFSEQDYFLLELDNEKKTNYINKKERSVQIEKLIINDITYTAGIVVADEYISELGNAISERNPELDFVAIVSSLRNISYRTVKDNIDLGKDIASFYGGGGHTKTAGSVIDKEVREDILKSLFKHKKRG